MPDATFMYIMGARISLMKLHFKSQARTTTAAARGAARLAAEDTSLQVTLLKNPWSDHNSVSMQRASGHG